MTKIEKKTFQELRVGDSASATRTLTSRDIELFSILADEANPTRMDPELAKSDAFHRLIGHGMWGVALISTLLGTALPGPGTIFIDQDFRFRRPVNVGETVVASVIIREKSANGHEVILACRVADRLGEVLIEGTAHVIAPTEKISRPRVAVTDFRVEDRGSHHRKLIEAARRFDVLRTGVVNPVDAVSLAGALEAARAGLIVPVLIGPEAAIREAAEAGHIDISGCTIVDAADARGAASAAVEMAARGEVGALMKGDLHTDLIMHPVISGQPNLQADRRLSHVFVMDIPSYDRPLLVTDAAVNIYPDLEAKKDIIQNAIDLAHAVGIDMPSVAVLSAVETVTPKIWSTIEAAALCKMADRGQITGGVVDGPLAFDNAVSAKAARIKHIHSRVAGRADILVVPDLEAGNMLAKQLEYLGDAEGAGIVLGARIPIILTSRADSTKSRLASAAVAVLASRHRHVMAGKSVRSVIASGEAA